jgi:hypothetical protein
MPTARKYPAGICVAGRMDIGYGPDSDAAQPDALTLIRPTGRSWRQIGVAPKFLVLMAAAV